MAQLTLQVLGMPRIQVDGAAVHIARRRVLACAVYLAVTRRAQSRDTLATLFWPEETQQNARADLRRTLHLLHRTFGKDHLMVEHEAVQLIHDQNLWLDLEHFRRLLAVCQHHGHATTEVCPACLPSLAAAAALYRDDFLAGFTLPDSPDFDQWQFQQGEGLRAELAGALERLVRGYTAQQAWEQAIAYARRWLALDPLHEPVQRWLMQVYTWSGQRSAALRQYRDCVQLLAQELGVEPEAETQRLQRLIKGHRLPTPTVAQLQIAPAPAARRAPSASAVTPAPATDEVRLLTVACAGLRPLPVEEEDLDQEAAGVAHLFTLAAKACTSYGGHVERVPGGDLLLTFGRDQIHEDDPERAVRAALELQAAALAAHLPIQIGINTGMVYCAPAAETDTRLGMVMGAVVNQAVQLRSRAAVGQLLIGKASYQSTRGSFAVTPLSITLTGATTPVTVYQIHYVHSHTAKVRGIEGQSHPLIGRTDELTHLQAALAQVQAGVGHLVLLSGPAGVGKSRLVSELKETRDWKRCVSDPQSPVSGLQSPILWLEGRCLAFATTASYALFVDALRGYLSAESTANEQGLAARLVALLQTLTSQGDLTTTQLEEMGPLLGRLLSLRFGTAWDERLQQANPQQIRSQTFQAVETLLAALARRRPVVLVCEDLHWADALSLELLAHLITQLPHLPLLLVCIYRPEGTQAGEPLAALAIHLAGPYTTPITLGELSSAQSSQLLTMLLAGATVPPAIHDLIVATAQGNPFFLEEMVRAQIERGHLYRRDGVWQAAPMLATVTAPETVQQVILSRVDQLAATQKRLLQSAAVIGRLFRSRLLAAILPNAANLEQDLAELTDQAFIYQERSLPECEYSFRHVLMQDAIYYALPGRRRARLHQSVAEALEQLYADDLAAYVEQLAYHYEHSPASPQTTRKAIGFMLQAGRKAQRAFLPAAALGYYQQTLARLTALPSTPERESWCLETYHGLAYSYLELSDFETAAHYEHQAIAQAQALALPPHEQVRYYGWLCRVLRAHGELDAVIRTCEAGLAILGDDQACWEAAVLNGNMADAYNKKGNRQQFRTIMAHVRAFFPQAPCTTGAIFVTYGHLVTLCLERKAIVEALMWWRLTTQGLQANNDLSPLSWAHTWVAVWLYEALGDSVSVYAHCQAGLDLCRQTGITYDLAGGLVALAQHHFVQGELDEAEAVIRQAQPYREEFGSCGEVADGIDLLARIAYCRSDLAVAVAQAEASLALVEQSGFTFARPIRQILLGQLYLAQGHPERAHTLFQGAVTGEPADVKGLPVLVAALASVEATLADAPAFQAYCRQVQAEKPDFQLQQWWLEPIEPDFRLSEALPDNLKSKIQALKWVDPFGDCAWTVAENSVVIRAANRRELWVNNLSAPRLLWSVVGDFAMQVVCQAAEANRPALGGLLLWQDQENYLRLTWGEYGAASITLVGCIGNEDQILGRGRLAHTGQVYLRLERVGTQVRALCRADGQGWFCVGEVTFSAADRLAVGVHAIGKIDRTFYPGAYPAGTAICFVIS